MNRNLRLLAAVLFPILALGAVVLRQELWQREGTEVVLPIRGFDPRDLLSGHYLRFQVDYGVPVCTDIRDGPAGVCLSPARRFFPGTEPPAGCRLHVRGRCRHRRFVAGIERFYIPEQQARELERKVRGRHAALRLSVSLGGHAAIRDLLIDGHPWAPPP